MSYIQFLGAAGTVTGSKHLINTGELQVLIDCGMFQGQKQWRERNWQPMPIEARDIDAVILTHAHLDHTGWLPRLAAEGFTGPVFCTPATADLCGVLLPDSAHLQEEEAEFHNRKKSSKHDPAMPLYTMEQAEEALKLLQPIEFRQLHRIGNNFSFRFVPAAHITGSGMVEIYLSGPAANATKRMLFTGDIGRVRDSKIAPGRVLHLGPETGECADVLVMESTYGNRAHPHEDVRPEMARIISETLKRGGTVIVPAFAVERTQKFLFLLKELMEQGQIPRAPVHIDSPMAIKAVNIFLKHSEDFAEDTKQLVAKYGSPLNWQGFYFDEKQEDSKKLNDSRFPMIIVSSSGMVTGGRVLHHLMHRLSDPKNTVLFIGFQAPGTRGAIIKSGAKSVRIFSEEVPIRAQVAALEQFSDHADTPELLEWLATFQDKPKTTYLVHGEPAAAQLLQKAIQDKLHWNVQIAQWMQKVEI